MSVRERSAAVESLGAEWPLVSALLGGTRAMRAAGKAYLPQWPAESDDSYAKRLATATLFPAFARTVDVLGAKPFSRPMTLADLPARVEAWCQDVDMQGRDLHAFAGAMFRHVMSHGIGGVLVDYPRVTGVRTQADEMATGARPYFVEVPAVSILGWRSERTAGAEVLTQFRFLEVVAEPDGPFKVAQVEQVRVLYPGRWEVWREDKSVHDGDRWKLFDEGVTTIQRIPFVPFFADRMGFMTGRAPLNELAHMNVEHWQSKSDQQTILHVARVPILFLKSMGGAEIKIGASSAIMSDSPDADGKFIEHSGAAIEAGRLSLLDLEDRMRQVGAELLVIKPGNATVAQTLSDDEPGMCALQRMVRDFERGLAEALGLMAEWVGEKPAGRVDIFDDFGVSTMAAATMDLLVSMATGGYLSGETLFQEAQRRGLIDAALTWDAEQARIAGSGTKSTA